MRSELVLILWVIAALSWAWAVSGGDLPGNFVASTEAIEDEDGVVTFDESEVTVSQNQLSGTSEALLTAAAHERRLFSEESVISIDLDIAGAPEVKELDYVLRGITRADGSWRAIFEGGDGQSQYLVVGLGESLGGLEVVGLEADRVVLTNRSDGSERILMLRGIGEMP